ncbi:MAG: hypothetical protein QNJ13_14325 [Paracoccaceae bacterium]|nr:hypothetical protein [Paracoccaceae bacterium]
MADVLFYRLLRLRRLIVVALAVPLATLWAMGALDDPLLFALAVTIPLAHALAYPNAWVESLTVSIVLAPCLALASMIDPGLSAGSIAIRWTSLAILWTIGYFMLLSPLSVAVNAGPTVGVGGRSRVRSAADAATLRRSITIYPGRTDGRTTCGEADGDGVFEVLTVHTIPGISFEMAEDQFDPTEAEAFNTAEERRRKEAGLTDDDTIEVRYKAVVQSSGADHHEVFTFEDPAGEVGVTRYDFEPDGDGTLVTIEERGAKLPVGAALGFWLQDFLTDHLVDEVDRAEGRAPRANHAFPQRQMVVDIANLIVPMMAETTPKNRT